MELDLVPDVVQLPMNILDTSLYKSGVLSELHKKGEWKFILDLYFYKVCFI